MAARSRTSPPAFGSPERQALTQEMHERMLARIDAATAAQAGASAAVPPPTPAPVQESAQVQEQRSAALQPAGDVGDGASPVPPLPRAVEPS
eukprot:366548-Chlamydomonas_euryale.AAC.1